MTTSVEREFGSFAVAVRSGRCRSVLLVLLGWLLLAQTLLVVHSVDHAKAENGAPCALCVAGDHLAGGAAPSTYHLPSPTPDTVVSTVTGSTAVAFRAAYRSRAPPQHLRS